MRFGIRNLLLVISVAAVVCALFAAARNLYFADRQAVHAVLGTVNGISIIEIHSHVDVAEEVNRTSISVDGQPGSIIELGDLGHVEHSGSFSIARLGPWRFRVSGRRFLGATNSTTGKPVESEYFGGHLELGPQSPYQDLIPFKVSKLQDVVDHYQDLVELFESWPREAQPGKVTMDDGSTQYFYVSDAGS